MNEQPRSRTDNVPNPPDPSHERLIAQTLGSACVPERISWVHGSLEAMRQRIEKAYAIIGAELPGIGAELISVFDKVCDFLDGLGYGESGGGISSMIDRLQALVDSLKERVEYMGNSTRRSIEALHDLGLLLSEHQAAQAVASPGIQPTSEPGCCEDRPTLGAVAHELERLLKDYLGLQGRFMERIGWYAVQGIPALSHSVSSVAAVMVRLASGSRAVKAALLRIMSSLQAHDIMDQDMSAISGGLKESLAELSHAGREDGYMGFLCFLERFSPLFLDLMDRICLAIRTHAQDMKSDLDEIEANLRSFDQDREALDCLQFPNTGERPLLEVIVGGMEEAACDLEKMAGSFRDVSSRLEAARCRLLRVCAEPGPGGDTSSIDAAQGGLAGLISALESATSQVHVRAVEDRVGELRAELQKARAWGGIDGARKLWDHTLAGTGFPAARYLGAMGVFRRHIHDLEKIPDEGKGVIGEMQSLVQAIAAIRAYPGDHLPRGEECELPRDLKRILERLRNPHSNLLAAQGRGEDCGEDGDLTIF